MKYLKYVLIFSLITVSSHANTENEINKFCGDKNNVISCVKDYESPPKLKVVPYKKDQMPISIKIIPYKQ